jgi:ribosome biogenesis GTPase A
MAKINWFPGHMAKALRMMQDEVKNVDAIIYVLDARAPLACINPSFINIIGDKPVLFILNKIDMADNSKIKEIKSEILTQNSDILELNSTASGALKAVTNSLNKLCKKQIERFKNKGVNYFVRAMVIGVPNSGKSTLVNNLCGAVRAITGNKPGVTKSKQWVKLSNNIEILDTPGTLWPDLDNEKVARQLSYIGSISDNVLPISELALFLIEDLLKSYKKEFLARYNLSQEEIEDKKSFEILELIGEKRKFLIKGGEIDYDRTADAIIDDFRKGRIGKITF